LNDQLLGCSQSSPLNEMAAKSSFLASWLVLITCLTRILCSCCQIHDDGDEDFDDEDDDVVDDDEGVILYAVDNEGAVDGG